MDEAIAHCAKGVSI
ncbi:hypothetical protein [Calothrix sp. UHCC 0171]